MHASACQLLSSPVKLQPSSETSNSHTMDPRTAQRGGFSHAYNVSHRGGGFGKLQPKTISKDTAETSDRVACTRRIGMFFKERRGIATITRSVSSNLI